MTHEHVLFQRQGERGDEHLLLGQLIGRQHRKRRYKPPKSTFPSHNGLIVATFRR